MELCIKLSIALIRADRENISEDGCSLEDEVTIGTHALLYKIASYWRRSLS